jgi:hypothetical protein
MPIILKYNNETYKEMGFSINYHNNSVRLRNRINIRDHEFVSVEVVGRTHHRLINHGWCYITFYLDKVSDSWVGNLCKINSNPRITFPLNRLDDYKLGLLESLFKNNFKLSPRATPFEKWFMTTNWCKIPKSISIYNYWKDNFSL